MLKGIYIKKRSKGNFVRENLKKIGIVIKNVIWSEKTLVHKAEHPSNNLFPILPHIIRLSR